LIAHVLAARQPAQNLRSFSLKRFGQDELDHRVPRGRSELVAHRADHTNSRPAPGPVGSPGWQLSSADPFTGFRAQNSLIGMLALRGPAGWSCQMPGGRTPVRVRREARWKAVRDYMELARETGPETGVGRCSDEDARLAERRAFVESRLTNS